ncbi:hypothetical protein EON63_18650 [archaeon]|nr:MAG: hypothetical protein EON63_18650 [archaeon]
MYVCVCICVCVCVGELHSMQGVHYTHSVHRLPLFLIMFIPQHATYSFIHVYGICVRHTQQFHNIHSILIHTQVYNAIYLR